MQTILHYLATLATFLVLDFIWLGFILRGFIRSQLGHLLAPQTNWPVAFLFYLIFIAGLIYFAVTPALQKDSFQTAVFNGAFFGLVTYATYELTNKALIDRWPGAFVVVDILWGAVLCAAVSAVSFWVGKKLLTQ